MKAPLKISLLIVCFAAITNAQFRVKAGLTYDKLSFKNISQFDIYSAGLNYMLGMEYNFSAGNIIGFETGVNYFRLKNEGSNGNADLFRSYIAVPLIFSYKPKSLLSPGIGLMVSSKVANNKIFEPIKTIDASAIGKLSIRPIEHIAVEIGYYFGFFPITKINYTDSNGNPIGELKPTNKFYFVRMCIDI
jgi:hypothetical protein